MHGEEAGTGNLLAAISEAGFLIGLEKNRFILQTLNFLINNFSYISLIGYATYI